MGCDLSNQRGLAGHASVAACARHSAAPAAAIGWPSALQTARIAEPTRDKKEHDVSVAVGISAARCCSALAGGMLVVAGGLVAAYYVRRRPGARRAPRPTRRRARPSPRSRRRSRADGARRRTSRRDGRASRPAAGTVEADAGPSSASRSIPTRLARRRRDRRDLAALAAQGLAPGPHRSRQGRARRCSRSRRKHDTLADRRVPRSRGAPDPRRHARARASTSGPRCRASRPAARQGAAEVELVDRRGAGARHQGRASASTTSRT